MPLLLDDFIFQDCKLKVRKTLDATAHNSLRYHCFLYLVLSSGV